MKTDLIKLTYPCRNAELIMKNINKDFPGVASVKGNEVYITVDYYNQVKKEVKAICKCKPILRSK